MLKESPHWAKLGMKYGDQLSAMLRGKGDPASLGVTAPEAEDSLASVAAAGLYDDERILRLALTAPSSPVLQENMRCPRGHADVRYTYSTDAHGTIWCEECGAKHGKTIDGPVIGEMLYREWTRMPSATPPPVSPDLEALEGVLEKWSREFVPMKEVAKVMSALPGIIAEVRKSRASQSPSAPRLMKLKAEVVPTGLMVAKASGMAWIEHKWAMFPGLAEEIAFRINAFEPPSALEKGAQP
jgi:hypothetical protein